MEAFNANLAFEDAPERLHRGVVVTVAGGAHAWEEARLFKGLVVLKAGVLAAAIGMVNHRAGWFARGQSALERLERERCVEMILQMPADDFAAGEVHDSGQIKPAFGAREVSDISDPYLV